MAASIAPRPRKATSGAVILADCQEFTNSAVRDLAMSGIR
jgi:hypothetical protein